MVGWSKAVEAASKRENQNIGMRSELNSDTT